MKEPRYTPGPWEVQHEFDDEPTFVADVNGIEIAEVTPFINGIGLLNAQLIAAAPDLLAALEEIKGNCEAWKTADNMPGRLYAICQSAIAKAAGQEV